MLVDQRKDQRHEEAVAKRAARAWQTHINRGTAAGATTLQRGLLGFGRHRRREVPRCKDADARRAARAQMFWRTAFRSHS